MKKTSFPAAGPVLVLLAAVFWGSMGLFVRKLSGYGFSALQITCLRLTVAALCFLLLLAGKEPQGFRIRLRDLPLFLGLGLASVLFFSSCYFYAISIMSLSTAAILLYTSPIWVMLMSILFFRERMTRRKLLALLLAFGGCVLVSGVQGGGLTLTGLLVGLGSGLGYGLYSILGTVALRRYTPYTVTAYTFVIAACGAWCVAKSAQIFALMSAAPSLSALLGLILLTGLVTAVIPFLTYTLGLQRMEASKAAILATVEPMVATLFGALVFHEAITLPSALGILLILSAVVLLNLRAKASSAT